MLRLQHECKKRKNNIEEQIIFHGDENIKQQKLLVWQFDEIVF